MTKSNSGLLRRLFIPAGAALAAVLAGTLETGRVHAQARGFQFLGALVRVITPNGDGKNDVAILCANNPKDSGVSATIYDLRGRRAAGMAHIRDAGGGVAGAHKACRDKYPPSSSPIQIDVLQWDGTINGRAAAGGVYLYRIQAEDSTLTGTVAVAR
ncbi:MAG: hypothetical protein HY922_09360 [Elusimicrobia bacterium]|nr:hypothetical protein [Elusimicrobiota bacterium]